MSPAFLSAMKRLPRRRPSPVELEAIRAVIWLRAARPGSDRPDPAFLERLGRRLQAEFGEVELDPNQVRRRRILRTAAVASSAPLTGGAADRLAQGAAPLRIPSPLVPDAGSWRPVSATSALPASHAMRLSTSEAHGVLVNEAGWLRALSGVCTHLGCLLNVNAGAHRLDRPCHELAYSWNGSVLYHRLQSRPAACRGSLPGCGRG